MGKDLFKLIFTGSLAFYSSGCSNVLQQTENYSIHPEYHFSGNIGIESVTYQETPIRSSPRVNVLTVKKPDGRIITYTDDSGNDLIIEKVEVIKGEIKRAYEKRMGKYENINEIEEEVMREAQKQFDRYLRQIKQINRAKALESIK